MTIVFLAAPMAGAFTFVDNNNFWPTWQNSSNDNDDTVGVPDILGGSGIIAGDFLTEVTFDYTGWTSSLYQERGDLFIDIGADSYWDWVIIGMNHVVDGTPIDTGTEGQIYKFDPGNKFSALNGLNNDAYVLSQTAWDHTGGIREYHPVWYNVDSDLGVLQTTTTATVVGFPDTPVIFSDLNIDLGGDNFILGWGPTCANDVVHAAIPEPATMLLFGCGLIGLAVVGRKKFQ